MIHAPPRDGLDWFSRVALPEYALRPYQVEPAEAILESIRRGLGHAFAVVFSRQAGKDELLTQLLVYLLLQRRRAGGAVVVAAPSFLPQAALTRDRLLRRLALPGPRALGGDEARSRDGYAVDLGAASVRFLSAAPVANARGQTADLLLVANEAQQIHPDTWDAVFDPMAASTNATTLFLGTIWDRTTLLARQIALLEEQQARDGARRVWKTPWQDVARYVPAYGDRVRARIAQFGADHPFIRTEYELRELDGAEGLFPPARIARLQGEHPRRHTADAGKRYALLLDVVGEAENAPEPGSWQPDGRRDSTALTVVEIGREPGREQPVYRIVDRQLWTGIAHDRLHQTLVDLARRVWRASLVIVDATGVGAGLARFLEVSLSARGAGPPIPVEKFIFSATSKSQLGWDFVALLDSGRLLDYADDGAPESRAFRAELAAVTYATPPGPGRLLRWGVPAGKGHDDLVMSAALAARIDRHVLAPRIARGVD